MRPRGHRLDAAARADLERLLRFACIAMAAVGAFATFAGLDDLRHGGGDAGRVVTLVGLALVLSALVAGVAVLRRGVRRG